MADVGTHVAQSNRLAIIGIAGVSDNDVVVEVDDASRYDEFYFMSTAGVLDVDVSLDGTNFATAIALTDEESVAPATKVLVTAAGILYSFCGHFKVVRVRQASVVAVANAVMICGRR